jgi:hypothetical protein
MAGREPVSTAELFNLDGDGPAERCHLCRFEVWDFTRSDEGDCYCRDHESCNGRARVRLHAEQPWRRRVEVERLSRRYG